MRVLLVRGQTRRSGLTPADHTKNQHIRIIGVTRTVERRPLVLGKTDLAHTFPVVLQIDRRSQAIGKSRQIGAERDARIVRRAINNIPVRGGQLAAHFTGVRRIDRSPVVFEVIDPPGSPLSYVLGGKRELTEGSHLLREPLSSSSLDTLGQRLQERILVEYRVVLLKSVLK